MAESLSEDCVRTAKVTIKLFKQPSTYEKLSPLLFGSVTKAIKDMKRSMTYREPVELVCENLNELFEINKSDFPNFELMKKNVQLPKPVREYYLKTPVEQSQLNRMQFLELADEFEDAEFLKYMSVVRFQQIKPYSRSPWIARSLLAEAVHQLSYSEAFKTQVDRVFEKALVDYIEDLFTRNSSFAQKMQNTLTTAFSRKVDEYFQKNSALQEEYHKILNTIRQQVEVPVRNEKLPRFNTRRQKPEFSRNFGKHNGPWHKEISQDLWNKKNQFPMCWDITAI